MATTVDCPAALAPSNDGVASTCHHQGCDRLCRIRLPGPEQVDLRQANKAGGGRPTMDAFQAAAANADWAHAAGYYNILANQPGEKSWPMTAATFILLPKDPPNKAAAKDALDFFKWAYEKGDKMAEDLDYIPMPDSVVALDQKMWASDIKQ